MLVGPKWTNQISVFFFLPSFSFIIRWLLREHSFHYFYASFHFVRSPKIKEEKNYWVIDLVKSLTRLREHFFPNEITLNFALWFFVSPMINLYLSTNHFCWKISSRPVISKFPSNIYPLTLSVYNEDQMSNKFDYLQVKVSVKTSKNNRNRICQCHILLFLFSSYIFSTDLKNNH